MRTFPLKRREMLKLLRHNGFERVRQRGSHEIWEGLIDSQKRVVSLDLQIEDFAPTSTSALYVYVMSQLGFMSDDGGAAKAWERFFAGEPSIARRANLEYRKWHSL